MIVLDKIHKINLPTVVALGSFDSIHLGHQKLIKEAVLIAKAWNVLSVVFTFKELPLNVISGRTVIKNVLTQEDKLKEIEKMGVDIVINADFDSYMQNMSPEDFVKDILVGKLNCSAVVCGYNYSFGKRGSGNAEMLETCGVRYGFDTDVIDEYKLDGQTVSSTAIRAFLVEGKVEKYKDLTGRYYSISGKVIEGQHFGTRMGYPTVNLNLSEDMALPANGVYVTQINVDGTRYKGVTNVGNKPTVGEFGKNAETHIFDFSGDLYGKTILVEFVHFLRPEYKFETITDLEKQISKDCENAKAYYLETDI